PLSSAPRAETCEKLTESLPVIVSSKQSSTWYMPRPIGHEHLVVCKHSLVLTRVQLVSSLPAPSTPTVEVAMRAAHVIGWSARLLTLFVLGAILTGCGTFSNSGISFGSRIGLRPDDPQFIVDSPTDPCTGLTEYIRYAVDLKESYRTRATQNRSWLYVAGIVGLGVAAASGGLGLAGAAAGTIALPRVSRRRSPAGL